MTQRTLFPTRSCAAVPSVGVLVVFVGLAWCAASARAQDAGPTQETWYVYRIAGKDLGHVRESISRGGTEVKTIGETLIVINRLGAKVEIKASSDFVETADGKLQSANSKMSSSLQSTSLAATVQPGKVVLRAATGGKEYRRELPYSGELVGPWGIRRKTASGLKKVGDVATCQTFMPELQRVVTVTRKLLDPNASLAVSGKSTACLKVAETLGGFPGVHETWIDGQGRMLRQTQSSPFGQTEMVIAEREAALHAGVGRFRARCLRRRCCTPTSGCLGRDRWNGWSCDCGKTTRASAGPSSRRQARRSCRGEIANSCSKCGRCRRLNPCGRRRQMSPCGNPRRTSRELVRLRRTRVFASFSRPTRSCNRMMPRSSGSLVRSWAARRTPFAACRLRDWVSDNMHMDLGIVLAPASEAIRQRKGTCAAYAITLASLARAAGIPSQVVMGYAYLSGIWGGHAWVEVWTGSRWVPLDGALPSTSAADAARIACARTSFAEGAGPLTSNLSRVFGNIQIEIMEFASSGASAGSTVKVPGGAAPFTVEGDTYRNPWLGLDVHKPADFRFTKTDAVYPDSTVVAIDDPMGNRVSLGQYALPSSGQEEAARRVFGHLELAGKVQQEKIAGRAVFVVDEGTKAGLAFAGDADLWVLTGEGPHAGERLRKAAAWVTVRQPAP